ncbi:MAG: hypothetical protein AAF497_22660, partial [Planctomycetota bacterium]
MAKTDPPTFSEVTERFKVMSTVALNLAKAREANANARLTHAKATGVHFQIMAAFRFLQKVEQETARLRRQARTANNELKKMKKQWRSAKVLFRGKRSKHYGLRRTHLELLLQEVMSETADKLFMVKATASSRNGKRNFINNNRNAELDDVPNAPNEIATGPELLQFVLDHRLVVKPLAPAMQVFSKMFKVVNDVHKKEVTRLNKVIADLNSGALDIWDDIPIFGRDVVGAWECAAHVVGY